MKKARLQQAPLQGHRLGEAETEGLASLRLK